jgi:hypothetical protein
MGVDRLHEEFEQIPWWCLSPEKVGSEWYVSPLSHEDRGRDWYLTVWDEEGDRHLWRLPEAIGAAFQHTRDTGMVVGRAQGRAEKKSRA